LLIAVAHKVDHQNIVEIVKKESTLATVREYLMYCQDMNNEFINEALIELFISDNDHKSLRNQVENYENFNKLKLANKLKDHENEEFRKIAAYLFMKSDDFDTALDMCKKNEFDKDAMVIAKTSKNTKVVTDLLNYFIENKKDDCFGESLFVCYDYIPTETALDMAYKNKLMDQTMPFICKRTKETNDRISKLEETEKKRESAKKEPEVGETNTPFGTLALPPA